MIESKPWYYSKTIWASLIAILAALGSVLGISVDQETQVQLSEALVQIVTVLASLFAIVGRISATTRID